MADANSIRPIKCPTPGQPPILPKKDYVDRCSDFLVMDVVRERVVQLWREELRAFGMDVVKGRRQRVGVEIADHIVNEALSVAMAKAVTVPVSEAINVRHLETPSAEEY